MKTYMVGGAVRDTLLGIEPKDRDYVVVGSTPEEMKQRGFVSVGRDFPVFLHPDNKEEYALARTERKVGRGYHGFLTTYDPDVSLEDDLLRRDLTINSMALDGDGGLIDPYAGAKDLKNKVLRHTSPAFAEDPLRVLRVARFSAKLPEFEIDPSTMTLMRNLVGEGELQNLTQERVFMELGKALTAEAPSNFIRVLRECGGLAGILPEVDALFGVPQVAEHHPEIDTGEHVMLALDRAAELSPDPIVRFAVLMHDLGKGVTPDDVLPQHINHESNGIPLVVDVCDRLKVPNEYEKLALQVTEHHLRMHKLKELRPGKILGILDTLNAFKQPENATRFATACQADAQGRAGLKNRPYPQADLLLECLVVSSRILGSQLIEQGVAEGPNLGMRLKQLRIEAIKRHVRSKTQEPLTR